MYRQFIVHVYACIVQQYAQRVAYSLCETSRGAGNISKLLEFHMHHKLFQAHLPSSVQHTHMHVYYVTV